MLPDLDQSLAKKMQSGMEEGGIKLPFYAPTIWWRNGSKAMKQAGGVLHFGGWAVSAEEFDDPANQQGIPPNFTAQSWTNREGTDFDVYAARAVAVAPIAKRKQWTVGDSGKPRSHVQILAYMAYSEKDKGLVPWGPVVLSAKGFAGKAVEDALRAWGKVTRPIINQYARGYPANLFYSAIGTFGKEPVYQLIGQGNQSSPITPCTLFDPGTITDKNLLGWFVGEGVMAAMEQCLDEAADWLTAWKKPDEAAVVGADAPADLDVPF